MAFDSKCGLNKRLIGKYPITYCRFQIAMPMNEEDLLIPSRLPVQKPVYSLPVKGNGGMLHWTHSVSITLRIQTSLDLDISCFLLVTNEQ